MRPEGTDPLTSQIPLAVTYNSDTSIIATVPVEAGGQYIVEVSNGGGGCASDTDDTSGMASLRVYPVLYVVYVDPPVVYGDVDFPVLVYTVDDAQFVSSVDLIG